MASDPAVIAEPVAVLMILYSRPFVPVLSREIREL
jgi:hypothetical protein